MAVLVGAMTHLMWDSFTHRSGVAVEASPALQVRVRLFEGYTPHVFTLLQHGSTILGLAFLAGWGVRWYRDATAGSLPYARPLPAWVRVGLLMAMILPSVAAGFLRLWPLLSAGESRFQILPQTIGRAVFAAGTVFLVMLMLTALVWQATVRTRFGE